MIVIKIVAERIIIVPLLTTQPWFTKLLRILVSDLTTLLTSKKALCFPYRRKTITKNARSKTVGLSHFQKSFKNKGFPEDIINVLL